MFESQNLAQDQVQQWIAQNPQFAQAVAQAMAGQPAMRYQPMAQNNQNWLGRNSFPTATQTSAPTPRPVPGLHGRIISDPNDIKPNEISMDGSASLFPMSDDSCIYAKAWGQDGMIQTIRYVPEKALESSTEEKKPSDEFIQVMARLEMIEKMLSQKGQNSQYQRQNYRNSQAQTNSKYDPNSKSEVTNNG